MQPSLSRLNGLLLALPPLAAYCVIGQLYPALTTQLALFVGFFTVFLALPALAFGRLLPLGERSWTESLFLGYPLAQVAYFLGVFSGARLGQPWLAAASPVLALILLLASPRSGRGKGATALPVSSLLLILAALIPALCICFIKFKLVALPTPGHPAEFYHDDVGTAAFVWSAARSIESGMAYMSPLISGVQYPYHVIYHYSYAFPAYALGLPPVEQILYFWPPLHWTMLAGAVVTGCRRLAGLSVLETGLAILLLLFSDGIGFNSSPSVQTMAYFHTFFFGLPSFILLLTSLYGYLSGRNTQISAAHLACCYFVAAGTKANLLPFLPIALFPVFVYRLYKRTAIRTDLKLAAGFCLSAVLLFFTHYQNLGHSQAQFKAFKFWKVFMGSLGNLGDMALVIGPFALLALIAADRDEVFRHKLRRDWQYHLFLLTFAVASAVFLKVVNYVGGDFYLYWQTRLITLVGFASLAAHAFTWRKRVVAPLTTLVLIAGVVLFALHLVPLIWPPETWSPVDAEARNIDAQELEGLRWASAHLDHTRSIFSNKDHFYGKYLGANIRIIMFDYLGFSGMQADAWPLEQLPPNLKAMVEERYAGYERFWAAKTAAEREEALRDIKADYYFHCERQVKSDFAGLSGLREVYRNPSLTIFELPHARAGQ